MRLCMEPGVSASEYTACRRGKREKRLKGEKEPYPQIIRQFQDKFAQMDADSFGSGLKTPDFGLTFSAGGGLDLSRWER